METNMNQEETKKSMWKASIFFFVVLVLEIPLAFLVGFIQSIMPAKYTTLISILITQGYLLLSAMVYLVVTKTSLTKQLQVRKYKLSSFFLSLVVLITAARMATWLNILS